jgi:hypothetical protein
MTFQHTRKILAVLGMAGAMAGIGAGVAHADNNTVDQWNDPGVSISAGLHGIVRPADMAVRKTQSLFAEPQYREELGAIRRSWGKSFCGSAETSWKQGLPSGSERCRDRGR